MCEHVLLLLEPTQPLLPYSEQRLSVWHVFVAPPVHELGTDVTQELLAEQVFTTPGPAHTVKRLKADALADVAIDALASAAKNMIPAASLLVTSSAKVGDNPSDFCESRLAPFD